MKVIFDGIIYSLQPQGGITRYANELISGMSKHNDVEVLMHKTRYNESPVQSENCTPVSLPFTQKILKYLSFPVDTFFTKQFISKKKYSEGIFHSTYYRHYKNLNIPQVVTVHDMIHERFDHFNTFSGRIFMKRKKKVVESADHVICISEQTKKDLQEKYNIPKEKISVVHHGVSATFFEKPTESELQVTLQTHSITKPFVLFVGTRGAYKNFEAFISAFATWKNKDVEVVVVGGGAFSKPEQQLVEVLKIKERVHALGNVTDEELRNLYTSAKALVFPTEYEGFGLPLLESYACGTPVIANDIPVFREIAADTPLYIDPKNQISFHDAFDAVLRDVDEDATMYRETLARSFTWEKAVEKTKEVYKRLIEN